MTTPTTLTPAQLAARKAEIATQQAADLKAVTDSEAALHLLADKLHNEAFARGETPSFAASLQAAATDIIAKAGKDFPSAALANLQRYTSAGLFASSQAGTDPIAAAEQAAEAADA